MIELAVGQIGVERAESGTSDAVHSAVQRMGSSLQNATELASRVRQQRNQVEMGFMENQILEAEQRLSLEHDLDPTTFGVRMSSEVERIAQGASFPNRNALRVFGDRRRITSQYREATELRGTERAQFVTGEMVSLGAELRQMQREGNAQNTEAETAEAMRQYVNSRIEAAPIWARAELMSSSGNYASSLADSLIDQGLRERSLQLEYETAADLREIEIQRYEARVHGAEGQLAETEAMALASYETALSPERISQWAEERGATPEETDAYVRSYETARDIAVNQTRAQRAEAEINRRMLVENQEIYREMQASWLLFEQDIINDGLMEDPEGARLRVEEYRAATEELIDAENEGPIVASMRREMQQTLIAGFYERFVTRQDTNMRQAEVTRWQDDQALFEQRMMGLDPEYSAEQAVDEHLTSMTRMFDGGLMTTADYYSNVEWLRNRARVSQLSEEFTATINQFVDTEAMRDQGISVNEAMSRVGGYSPQDALLIQSMFSFDNVDGTVTGFSRDIGPDGEVTFFGADGEPIQFEDPDGFAFGLMNRIADSIEYHSANDPLGNRVEELGLPGMRELTPQEQSQLAQDIWVDSNRRLVQQGTTQLSMTAAIVNNARAELGLPWLDESIDDMSRIMGLGTAREVIQNPDRAIATYEEAQRLPSGVVQLIHGDDWLHSVEAMDAMGRLSMAIFGDTSDEASGRRYAVTQQLLDAGVSQERITRIETLGHHYRTGLGGRTLSEMEESGAIYASLRSHYLAPSLSDVANANEQDSGSNVSRSLNAVDRAIESELANHENNPDEWFRRTLRNTHGVRHEEMGRGSLRGFGRVMGFQRGVPDGPVPTGLREEFHRQYRIAFDQTHDAELAGSIAMRQAFSMGGWSVVANHRGESRYEQFALGDMDGAQRSQVLETARMGWDATQATHELSYGLRGATLDQAVRRGGVRFSYNRDAGRHEMLVLMQNGAWLDVDVQPSWAQEQEVARRDPVSVARIAEIDGVADAEAVSAATYTPQITNRPSDMPEEYESRFRLNMYRLRHEDMPLEDRMREAATNAGNMVGYTPPSDFDITLNTEFPYVDHWGEPMTVPIQPVYAEVGQRGRDAFGGGSGIAGDIGSLLNQGAFFAANQLVNAPPVRAAEEFAHVGTMTARQEAARMYSESLFGPRRVPMSGYRRRARGISRLFGVPQYAEMDELITRNTWLLENSRGARMEEAAMGTSVRRDEDADQ